MSSEFHAGFKRETTGIHTVEGNLAGSRAAKLTKKREKQQQEYEQKKQKIQNEYKRGGLKINEKFGGSATDQFEAMFKSKTIGLVTADEFRKAREDASKVLPDDKIGLESIDTKETVNTAKKSKKNAKISILSFEEENDEETFEFPKKKVSKNPNVDTSFLPDKERESELEAKKSQLKLEWLQEQERVKQEMLEVTFSYWDGTGHKRIIEVKKGTTIGRFLEEARQKLLKDFSELRNTSSDSLMYIKEDLIIPHTFSFYDLIVTKARGKSGPLFHFDVHDDIRLVQDVRIEKDESHPGKVVERRCYERCKHIYPASRWEPYDPNKDYGTYKIHGLDNNLK